MTRIELKFKIPYGAIREILFQTATHLSFKKKKKKNARPYKKKQPLIHGTNRRKKKSLCNKNPKTQIIFPNQNSYSLRLLILRCSFKHTDRTCVFQPIKQTKKKASATIKTSVTVEISVRSLQQAIYKLSDLCSSTINNS